MQMVIAVELAPVPKLSYMIVAVYGASHKSQ